MDNSLLKIAIVLFVIAAVFGLTVLVNVLRNKTTPKLSVLFHGFFAATALVLVLAYAMLNIHHAPVISLILFIIAALGGFTLLYFDLVKKHIPKALALLHPAIAVIALLLLLGFVFM